MTENKPTKAAPDYGEFATNVIARFKWNMTDEVGRPAFAGNADIEVRQCANGLALIGQLLDNFKRKNRLTGTQLAASGISDAEAIVDYLTTGRAHPIATHIKGINSKQFRPRRAPANTNMRRLQKRVVGAVLAIEAVDGRRQTEAIKLLIAELRKAKVEFAPTFGQVRSWYQTLTAANDPDIAGFKSEIIRKHEAEGNSIFQEAVWIIFEHSAVAGERRQSNLVR